MQTFASILVRSVVEKTFPSLQIQMSVNAALKEIDTMIRCTWDVHG